MTLLAIALSLAIAAAITGGLMTWAVELKWLRRTGRWDADARRETWLSLSPLPINAIGTLLLGVWWNGVYRDAHAWAPAELPLTPLTVVAAFFAVDFSYYWEHRCAHRVPLLWSLYHEIHHSSDRLTVATAYRVSLLNQLLAPAFYLPCLVLGFPTILVVGFQLLATHYQAWTHTEAVGRLGLLDRIFNTPSNHRIHHSRAPIHRDKNLGAMLMIWDRLFGTYAAESGRLHYGVPDVPPPTTALGLYLDPWQRSLSRRS